VDVDVASDGISSVADTVAGMSEEDFFAVQTPRAYNIRIPPLDCGTFVRYQRIATGVRTTVCRIPDIEPWQTLNYLVNFCWTVI